MAPNQKKHTDEFGINPKEVESTAHTHSSGLDDTKRSKAETGIKGDLTFLGIPLLSIITCSFASVFTPVWKSFCAIRWVLASPIKIRFLPKCFPGFKGVPYFKHLAHVTYGEVRREDDVISLLYHNNQNLCNQLFSLPMT